MVECRGLGRLLRVIVAALLLGSCGGTRLQAPPPVFPLKSAWSTPLERIRARMPTPKMFGKM